MERFSSLLARLYAIQGIPLRELAEAHGYEIKETKGRRSFAGDLAQLALGRPPNSEKGADLPEFELELKTVPIGHGFRPHEATKVGALNYAKIQKESWFTSSAYTKLRGLLFQPVVKHKGETSKYVNADEWYFRSPFIWLPNREELTQLQEDWEEIRRWVIEGQALTRKAGGPGRYLTTIRSGKGEPAGEKRIVYESQAGIVSHWQRAFYLRKDFVEELVKRNIQYVPQEMASM